MLPGPSAPALMTEPVSISLPDWTRDTIDWDRAYPTDEDQVRLAIALSRWNVEHDTGGPFGAAVFEQASGRLVAVGVNRVVPLGNSVLHGETVAIMMAQAKLGTHTLGAPPHVLATSCEPCAMCLGATLWSGVRRLVCGATKADAERVGFDEGPVFPESYDHLDRAGIAVRRAVCRAEAAAVLDLYRERHGTVY